MYAKEEAFKRSADFLLSKCTVLTGICLASGVLLSSTVCGPELGEWNTVNGMLCGALAASIHFAQKSCPKVLQNAFRITKGDMTVRELKSDGLFVAVVSSGLVVIPALLVLSSISGLFSLTIGVCAESAPLFFCSTIGAMLAQMLVIANVAKIHMEAAGIDVHNVEATVHECASKTKEVAINLGRNGYSMAMSASDKAMPTIHAAMEKGRCMIESRPKYLTMEYWNGPEGRSLLHC